MSESELELRRFHGDVRKLKKVCRDNNIALLEFDEALNDDVCILSRSEYEIGSAKEYLSNSLESYFVHDSDFSRTQQLFDHGQIIMFRWKLANYGSFILSAIRSYRFVWRYRTQSKYSYNCTYSNMACNCFNFWFTIILLYMARYSRWKRRI